MAARHGVADLVFFNGTVLTMDPRVPEVRAVAVREGRIIALGEDADIEPLTNAGTRLEDLEGRTIMPGLLDARDPDDGRSPPPCIEPGAVTGTADAAVAMPTPAESPPDPEGHLSEGVVALRLPTVSVDRLQNLLALERQRPSRMHLQVSHWPACGAAERALLQAIMRERAQMARRSAGSLRVQFHAEPAVVVAPPVDSATSVEGALPAAPGTGVDASAVAALPEPGTVEPPAAPAPTPSPWALVADAMRRADADRFASLRAFTVEAAGKMGLEQEAGMLAPGKRADLIVMDRDPSRESPDRVAETVVLQTWFGGELAYEREVQRAP